MYCMHCGAELPEGGQYCIECGKEAGTRPGQTTVKELTPEQREMIAKQSAAAQARSSQLRTHVAQGRIESLKWVLVIIVGFVVALGFLGSVLPELPDRPSKSGALRACKKYVVESLWAPTTAEFPSSWGEAERVIKYTDGSFGYSSYVDAQNAFGANIRNKFRCIVLHVTDETWLLLELSFY